MKNNKLVSVFILLLSTIFLSGCSLGGSKQVITNAPAKYTSGIFKTVDGGESWDSKSLVYSDTSKVVTIADSLVYDIQFSPYNNYMFVTTKNNGIYYSTNDGEQWDPLFTIGKNTNAFSFVKDSGVYFVGYKNILYKTINTGINWEEIYRDLDSEIIDVKVDADYSDKILLFMADGRILETTNGKSFKKIYDFTEFYKDNTTSYVYKTDSADLLGIKKVYVGGQNGNNLTDFYVVLNNGRLYYTQNGGYGFVEKDMKRSGITETINFLEFYPDSYKSFIVAINNDGLYRTNNAGKDFYKMNILTNKTKNVTAVAISPKNQNVIYYAAGSLIYKTIDDGKTWVSIVSPVTRIVSSLSINPSSVNGLYLGSDIEQRLVTDTGKKGILCDLFGILFPAACGN